MPERRHDLEDGKYTVILAEDGHTVRVLRHGEPWRDFIGDKFVSLLVQAFFEGRPDHDHKPVQHRDDLKESWCDTCGLNRNGEPPSDLIKETK